MSIESVMPSNHLILCHHPLLLLPSIFSASGSFPMSQFFISGGQSIGASIPSSTFQWIFRTDFLQDGLVWSPCCPRGSQESSPTPQFKSIKSLALSFLYSSTLTSVHILRSMKYRIFLYLINGNRHEWVCKTRINCILFINWLGSCQTVIMVLFKPGIHDRLSALKYHIHNHLPDVVPSL